MWPWLWKIWLTDIVFFPFLSNDSPCSLFSWLTADIGTFSNTPHSKGHRALTIRSCIIWHESISPMSCGEAVSKKGLGTSVGAETSWHKRDHWCALNFARVDVKAWSGVEYCTSPSSVLLLIWPSQPTSYLFLMPWNSPAFTKWSLRCRQPVCPWSITFKLAPLNKYV